MFQRTIQSQEIQLERKNWYYSEIQICQTSMGNENWYEKSGVKLHCSTEGKETSFGSSYRVVGKSEGLKNWDSTEHDLFWKY